MLKDIRPPVNFPPSYFFLIILACLIILAGLVILVIFIKKRLKNPTNQPKFCAPKRPAHVIAYEELNKLLLKNLPEFGKIKEYYYQLANIVRNYLENRFNLRAPEKTTEELLYSLSQASNLLGSHKDLLKQFLEYCDLVKFAKYGPNKDEIKASFDSAKKLVDETKISENEVLSK